ncbi:unnamed protein product [Symbiodinium sp. CCMP2592]|nr:unnamed protein product [Symbiodinium sp. CCMP2592]
MKRQRGGHMVGKMHITPARPPGRMPARAARAEEVPVWEAFEDLAGRLHGAVLDLSMPTVDLLNVWGRVLAERSRWQQLDAEGLLEWPDSPGRGRSTEPWPQPQGDGCAQQAISETQKNWKGLLQQAYQQTHRKVIPKDEISYVVEAVESQFRATVQAPLLSSPFQGELSINKKQAEHAAARAAIYSDFPKYAEVPEKAQKATESAENAMNAKMKLNEMVQLLTGRPVVKEEIAYEVQELPVPGQRGSQYVATVRLASLDDDCYEGEPASNKKQAEHFAAQAAVAAMAERVQPLEEERREAKRRKTMEARRGGKKPFRPAGHPGPPAAFERMAYGRVAASDEVKKEEW